MRLQFLFQRVLVDRARDRVHPGDVAHALRRQIGERLQLAEDVAGAELTERDLLAGRRLGADVDAAVGDQIEPLAGVAADDDLLAGLELVELRQCLEPVAILLVEDAEALGGDEREHARNAA